MTQQKLAQVKRLCTCVDRGFHAERLMRAAAVVVKAYPAPDNTAGMLDGLEAMPMCALFLQRADHTFDHSVLRRAVRRDEFLAQPVASHQGGVATRREESGRLVLTLALTKAFCDPAGENWRRVWP
ncbi:hypothetical protein L503_0293 [Bordetella holmesii CDC-H809-BH]|nr:hypothetical protein L503_0293 [Bordetella holmesii CDC-H809-BH]